MAMIKCPECGRLISNQAPVCLGCGVTQEYIQAKLAEQNAQNQPDQKTDGIETETMIGAVLNRNDIITCPVCGNKNKTENAEACVNCGFPLLTFCQEKKDMAEIVNGYRKANNIPDKEAEKRAEEARKAEEARRIAEAKKAAEAKKIAEVKRVEEARKAEEAKKKAEKRWKMIGSLSAAAATIAVLGFAAKVVIPSISGNSADETGTNEINTAYAVETETSEASTSTEWQQEYSLLCEAEEGETVYFGTYEQDNDTTNGQEAIEWIVLDKEDGKILVISKYALDCQPYNEDYENVTWETCTLRTWLNDTFKDAAFSKEEQAIIQITTVTADANPYYSTDPGNDTDDPIFLLSIDEANEYFSSDDERMCVPTAYAVAQGAYVNDSTQCCWWWLLSPGYYSTSAAIVDIDGWVSTNGLYVFDADDCVRPALWINLES